VPKLLSESRIQIEWADLNRWMQVKQPRHTRKRTSGVHLSGVLKPMVIAAGKLKLNGRGELPDDEFPMVMALGMAFENWIVGLYPDLVWQPGEVSLDGIIGSPDGYSLIDDVPTVEEFKCTYKSQYTRANILDETAWMWQQMGYCKMQPALQSRLHVFYVNGDYRPPSPQYRTYLIQYTQAELDKMWAAILKNKHLAKAEEH
jgi:hypothetical protein